MPGVASEIIRAVPIFAMFVSVNPIEGKLAFSRDTQIARLGF